MSCYGCHSVQTVLHSESKKQKKKKGLKLNAKIYQND